MRSLLARGSRHENYLRRARRHGDGLHRQSLCDDRFALRRRIDVQRSPDGEMLAPMIEDVHFFRHEKPTRRFVIDKRAVIPAIPESADDGNIFRIPSRSWVPTRRDSSRPGLG